MICRPFPTVFTGLVCLALAITVFLAPPRVSAEVGNSSFPIHDPSRIIRFKDRYWVFFTGRGCRSAWSSDLTNWTAGPAIFPTSLPAWADAAAPGHNPDVWAPDIVPLNGQFYLYYCISVFGKNTSGIGLATNPTLDPDDPNYKWTDQGIVVQTVKGDKYNALDPCPVFDADRHLWLVFGSYWTGIKLIQLDSATGKRVMPDSPMWPLAHHSSIEAAYIHYHAGWYYLFVNWDQCCRGTNSTYNIREGRSRSITGPYLDKRGTNMMDDGGSLFLSTQGRFIGPGHVGIFAEGTNEWIGTHFYDPARPERRGRPTLDLRRLGYDAEGWPRVLDRP